MPKPAGRTGRWSYYAEGPIRETLAKAGRIGTDPYHVEAFMRLEFGTLDHLGGTGWRRAVLEAADCVDAAGPADSERLAESYGL